MAASARYVYSTGNPLGGMHLANFARYQIMAFQEFDRTLSIADSITGAGTTPINLDNSPEFGLAAGQGALLEPDLVAIKAALATLKTTIGAALAKLDPG